ASRSRSPTSSPAAPAAVQSGFAADAPPPSPSPSPRSSAPAPARYSSCPTAARYLASAAPSVSSLRQPPPLQRDSSSSSRLPSSPVAVLPSGRSNPGHQIVPAPFDLSVVRNLPH